MPVFVCDKCDCLENSACCDFWHRYYNKLPLLCSECDPEIRRWHGRFEKSKRDGNVVDIINRDPEYGNRGRI